MNFLCGWCRDKEHSTIIYESGDGGAPLLRLGWNKQDPRYMATILMDSSKVQTFRFQTLASSRPRRQVLACEQQTADSLRVLSHTPCSRTAAAAAACSSLQHVQGFHRRCLS